MVKNLKTISDAGPIVLHGMRTADAQDAHPILIGEDGDLAGSLRGSLTHQSPANVTTASTQVIITSGKVAMMVQNIGSSIIYFGGSGVTSSSYAFKIVPTQIVDFGGVKSGFNFYVICSTGTSTLGIAEYA